MKRIICFLSIFLMISSLLSAFSFKDIFSKETIESAKKAGEAISKATEEITPEQEYYIGRAVAASILSKYKPYNNQALLTYIKKICNTLVINSDMPELYLGYRVLILDTDEINAFATPGGHIFVTKGLIKCTKSEDALAAVIAHEIGHIQLKHATKAIKSSRTWEAVDSLSQAAQSTITNDKLKQFTDAFGSGVGDCVDTLTTTGYSQKQEFEADKKALDLLFGAGYDPNGLLDMLNVLAEQTTVTGGMMSTHPSPKSRITQAKITMIKFKAVTTQEARKARFETTMKKI